MLPCIYKLTCKAMHSPQGMKRSNRKSPSREPDHCPNHSTSIIDADCETLPPGFQAKDLIITFHHLIIFS